MMSKDENLKQFNQILDEVAQNKTHASDIHDENAALWALGDRLRDTDFSQESNIRHSLRRQLMNNLAAQQSSPPVRLRLSLTWLVAIFTIIVAATILMSAQSNESPSYTSLIQQPEETPTAESMVLTMTPIVPAPSLTPAPTNIVNIVPLDEIFSTYYLSDISLSEYQVLVIATQDIPANTVLTADMLTEVLIPIESAPESGYSSVELLVGLRVSTDIPQWSPIESASRERILLDPNHIAIMIPHNALIVDELKDLAEGEHFSITGTFRFIDIDESFQQTPAFATLFPPDAASDGNVQVVSEEIVSDAVIVWSNYQQDFSGCPIQSTTIDVGTGENILIISPARYPCLITISMPSQDAVVFTWALESEIPMTIAVADSE